jgi:hypothetical protein
MRVLLWKLIHWRCVSRKPFNSVDFTRNLTWWGRLLHIHIDRVQWLRRSLLWIL